MLFLLENPSNISCMCTVLLHSDWRTSMFWKAFTNSFTKYTINQNFISGVYLQIRKLRILLLSDGAFFEYWLYKHTYAFCFSACGSLQHFAIELEEILVMYVHVCFFGKKVKCQSSKGMGLVKGGSEMSPLVTFTFPDNLGTHIYWKTAGCMGSVPVTACSTIKSINKEHRQRK